MSAGRKHHKAARHLARQVDRAASAARGTAGGYQYRGDQTGMPDDEVAARVAAAKERARAARTAAQYDDPQLSGEGGGT